MDDSRFDALSRSLSRGSPRRRVLAGLASTLGAIPHVALGITAAGAKKKKRCRPCKKRKKGKCKGTLPDGTPCPGGVCCNGVCSDALRAAGEACALHDDCCSNYCQTEGPSPVQSCAPTCRGKACGLDSDCCPGLPCQPVEADGSEYRSCGGCQDAGESCDGDADCCFSDCAGVVDQSYNYCLSHPGESCAKNFDCWSCYFGEVYCTVTVNGAPRDICQDGVCGCPDHYGCCSFDDCPVGEFCAFFSNPDGGGLDSECRPMVIG